MENTNEDEEMDILQNIFNEHYSYRRYSGKQVEVEFGERYGFSSLCEIESFVKAIVKIRESRLKVDNSADPLEFDRWPLREHYTLIRDAVDIYDTEVFYSPAVELFFNVYAKILGYNCRLPDDPFEKMHGNSTGMEKFISIAIEIKKSTGTEYFKKKVKAIKDGLQRASDKAYEYEEKIFEKYARLLVLRMDLHLSSEIDDNLRLLNIRSYFNKFLNNRRSNKIFKNVVGYIWKLEEGDKRRFHYHVIFFVNGSESQKDVYICQQIGEYWNLITKQEFGYFNVNANKKELIAKGIGLGIGMINYYDDEKRRSLRRIIDYFFKEKQYLRSKVLKKMHVFGTGVLRKQSNLGRPRTQIS